MATHWRLNDSLTVVTFTELARLVADGQIAETCLVQQIGTETWEPLTSLIGLDAAVRRLRTPSGGDVSNTQAMPLSDSSKVSRKSMSATNSSRRQRIAGVTPQFGRKFNSASMKWLAGCALLASTAAWLYVNNSAESQRFPAREGEVQSFLLPFVGPVAGLDFYLVLANFVILAATCGVQAIWSGKR